MLIALQFVTASFFITLLIFPSNILSSHSGLKIQVTQLVRRHAFIYHDIEKQTCLIADLNGSNSLRADGVWLYS